MDLYSLEIEKIRAMDAILIQLERLQVVDIGRKGNSQALHCREKEQCPTGPDGNVARMAPRDQRLGNGPD